MSLASRISALASRVGLEVKTKIDATHPGVARAWVCFGYVGTQLVVRASHNVASVTRTAAGRYRVTFAVAMPDANYCWTALARSSTNSGTQRIATPGAVATFNLRQCAAFDATCYPFGDVAEQACMGTFVASHRLRIAFTTVAMRIDLLQRGNTGQHSRNAKALRQPNQCPRAPGGLKGCQCYTSSIESLAPLVGMTLFHICQPPIDFGNFGVGFGIC